MDFLFNASFNLTNLLQVILLVSMTNGSVREVYNFLTCGKRRPKLADGEKSPPIWTLEDDALLISTDQNDVQLVIDRFGLNEVHNRLLYLSDTSVNPSVYSKQLAFSFFDNSI